MVIELLLQSTQCVELVTVRVLSDSMAKGSFKYGTVRVLKDKLVGVGAYGTVYLAMCDELLCAAKIIHKAFFDNTADPSARRIMERFQQECDFISRIRHPNIVQYLGIHQDEGSKYPVLLMELLDDNLTDFLYKQYDPLPFHTQVNILHDVSLAVAYLHYNKVIHRDLSSNNVLLVGNAVRAKVVDFGVAKLIESRLFRQKQVTQVPGTAVYMAPEVLKDNPECDEKVDCFSLGVLIVQIVTRLFPDPGPRTKTVQDSSSNTSIVEHPIPDVERRKNHIDLIDPSCPLLPIAMECMSYSHKDRPSAKVVCQRLAVLKGSEQFKKSQKVGEVNHPGGQNEAGGWSIIRSTASDETVQLQNLQEVLIEKDCLIRQLEAKIAELESQIKALCRKNNLPPSTDVPRREMGDTPVPMAFGSVAVDGPLAYFRPSNSRDVHVFDSTTKEWSCTPSCKRSAFSLAIIDGLLTVVGGYNDNNADTATLLSLVGNGNRKLWVEHFTSMPTKRSYCAVAVTRKYVVVIGGMVGTNQALSDVELMDIESKSWLKTSKLLSPLSEATATVYRGRVYLVGGRENTRHWTCSVYTCSLSSLENAAHPSDLSSAFEPPVVWVRITDLPVSRSFCAVAGDNLLVVCGKRDGLRTDIVLRYNLVSNSWEEFERSSCARSRCLVAVLPGDRLMIVGGWGNSGQILQSYEMIDILS